MTTIFNEPVKAQDLKAGNFYTCLISNRPVYIAAVRDKSKEVQNETIEWTEVEAWVYNSVTGYNESYYPVVDNVLIEKI